MAYIEENLRIRRQQQDASEGSSRDLNDEFTLSERWKMEKKTADEGSVTNSLAMLTAIPEVDLGMECVIPPSLVWKLSVDHVSTDTLNFFSSTRLRNIEETEKAKRQVAEERKERKKVNTDEEHLVATRCTCLFLKFLASLREWMPCAVYRPHMKQKSDVEIMRDAKLEAMGLLPQEDRKMRHDKPQMATDELVRGYIAFGVVICL